MAAAQAAATATPARASPRTPGTSATYSNPSPADQHPPRRAPASPSLEGFDVFAFLPASRSVLEDLAARCDRLGIAHSGIYETGAGPRLDVPDPDGTVVRFYYYTGPTDGFTGLEMRDGQVVGTYHTPQLQ